MISKRTVVLCLAAAAAFGGTRCGSGSSPVSPPTPAPTVVPTPEPTPTPPSTICTEPTPPPLIGVHMKVHSDQGFRKTIDASPQVANVDGYCGKVGFHPGARFCFTRLEGHPQRGACDALAVGVAGDTGRYGPTWFFDGGPCVDGLGDSPGCTNHPTNQFLVIAKGTGDVAACASEDVPVNQDRCGVCKIEPSRDRCK